ncbi:MAG: PilZ domain-containing protein, partial [Myxococcales bacterium]|nr:PilZ domain-containing protein [Myxococcales bacterium]
QAHASRHPAVLGAAEAVAGALGNVHALTRIGQAGQPGAAAAASPLAPLVPPVPLQAMSAPRAAGAQHAPAGQPGAPPAYPQAQGYGQPVAQGPAQGGAPHPGPAAAAPPGRQPATRTAPTADRPPVPPGGQGAGQGGAPGARPFDVPIVTAELGAHSPSNFYKGLSGNDIVEHGGLFVSTYKLPKLGQPVRLKVALPGGYEFEANAVVRWRREANDAGSDAPPGFGAQFTEITTEARQLVYRYVRNREPMFHDDL